MSRQATAWHAEHLNFARLLRLFEEQVILFSHGQNADYQMMQDIVYYLRHFPDVHHHRYENEVYKRMRESDPTLGPLVARLLQEHRVIAACGDNLLRLLEEVMNDGAVARAELEAAAATYLVYYRAHIETEEAEMAPRAATTLKAADWAAVADKVETESAGDPLFGPHAE